MNTVQVTVYAQQGAWDGPNLWFQDDEPAVLAEIRAARERGLQVVLILRVALSHDDPENRFLWHGSIWPRTEPELQEWFRRYTHFTTKWARIADSEGVHVLGIGSELNSLLATLPVETTPGLAAYYQDDAAQDELRALVDRHGYLFGDGDLAAMGASDFASVDEYLRAKSRADRDWAQAYTFAGQPDAVDKMNQRRALLDHSWRALIADVRSVYDGRLTLAANFDNYQEVGFWDSLDLMGVNAYFPLRKTLDEPLTADGLERSWEQVLATIGDFKLEHELDLPVLFTELGYTQRSGSTVAPWSQTGIVPLWSPLETSLLVWSKQELAPQERAMAVRALASVWRRNRSLLAGVLYWKLSSRRELGRYEPFMLYIGPDAADPLFDALSQFSLVAPPDIFGRSSSWRDSLLQGARLRDLAAADDLPAAISHAEWDADELQAALSLAAEQASLGTVERLLDAGAVPERADPSGLTPLHIAARRGNSAILGAMLTRSAGDPTGRHGFRPIHHAAYYGQEGTFRLLWSRETAPRPSGESALLFHHAAHGGNVGILQLLLDAEVPANASDSEGRLPLHLAAAGAHRDAVRLLLASGADIDRQDSLGRSALHLAAANSDSTVLRSLLEQQADLATKDEAGNTPLHYAAAWGRVENARLLLAAGTVQGSGNDAGLSPLDLARESGNRRVELFLRDHPTRPPVVGSDGRREASRVDRNQGP